MRHDLRCDLAVFELVKSGRKNFEIRKNDRGYEVGDILILHQTRGPDAPEVYTGHTLTRRVSCLIAGERYGLQPGYIAMGLTE